MQSRGGTPANHAITLTVLEPCSAPEPEVLVRNLAAMRAAGFSLNYLPYETEIGERLSAAGVQARGQSLQAALSDPGCRYIVAARGGYGASDLLRHLDWRALSRQPGKMVVGFSDITALQVSLYSRLGWPGIHGPMPGSLLWRNGPDVEHLLQLLSTDRPWGGRIAVDRVANIVGDDAPRGILFGGCLSVLSGLIGTPYLPTSLEGHILFLEDAHESAARVLRFWNQWLDSGLLDGVSAVVLGCFTELFGEGDEDWLVARLAERCAIPLYQSRDFGHVTPNYPLVIGSEARITNGSLSWTLA